MKKLPVVTIPAPKGDFHADATMAMQAARHMQTWIEEAHDHVKKVIENQKLTPSCKGEGCSGCCHQIVVVTFPEALLLALFLLSDTANVPLVDELLRQAGMLSHRSQDIGMGIHVMDLAFTDTDETITRANYFDRSIPCPFLRGGGCAVYPARPGACRFTYALSDPTQCNPPSGKVQTVINTDQVHELMAEEAAKVCHSLNLPQFAIPIQIAVSSAILYLTQGADALRANGVPWSWIWRTVAPPEVQKGLAPEAKKP